MSGEAGFSPNKDDLLFVPLGGAGEIGMNLNLFHVDGKWLMVDLGVTFGDDRTPGVDVLMPDPSFIRERRGDLLGLVLTHAHEDHIGAVQYLWPMLRCPIYASPFTAAVLRRKLEEAGLAEAAEITVVDLESRFEIGPFDIELITLTHSIPEPSALVIRTRHGTILHTGDWKFDQTPLIGPPPNEVALRALGDEGVLALVGDSTNVLVEGEAGSEAAVRESLVELVGKYQRRVAIACFASNVARLETVAAVAEAHGRHAALVGRSLWRIHDAARACGYLTDIPRFLSEQEGSQLPDDKVVLACTGSQGEPRAALARIAAGSHPHVSLDPGDVVIFSARIIPGNERGIGRLHDALIRRGIEVVSEKDHFVHVSGHPCRDELVRMYQWVRPRIAVPVHGEARHLRAHEALARECQISEAVSGLNGDVIRLAGGRTGIVDQVSSGRLAVDGTALLPIDGEVLRTRRRMIFAGAAVASVVLDSDGVLAAEPQVSLQGVIDMADEDGFRAGIVGAVREAVEDLSAREKRDDEAVREAARRAVRRALNALRGKKPPTEIHLVRLP